MGIRNKGGERGSFWSAWGIDRGTKGREQKSDGQREAGKREKKRVRRGRDKAAREGEKAKGG